MATADGVSELVTAVSVPRHAGAPDESQDLESELLCGGFLQSRHQPYDGYFENLIVLPRPLRAGERHEYGLRLRIPDGQLMNSHYVHVPRRRSDHFELRIRFGDPRPPGRPGWCERPRRRSSTEASRRASGSTRMVWRYQRRLHRLAVGLGYGVCWPEPARTSPGS